MSENVWWPPLPAETSDHVLQLHIINNSRRLAGGMTSLGYHWEWLLAGQ